MNANLDSATVTLLREHVLNGDVVIVDFFPTAFGVSLPTTGATDSITIDMDSSFILYYINGNVSQPAGTNIPFPDILVDIKNQGSGRYFSKQPMHWNTMVGNAQNPFFIPEPYLLAGGSNLQIQLTNLSGGSFARVDMTWIGIKARGQQGFNLSDLSMPIDFAYSR